MIDLGSFCENWFIGEGSKFVVIQRSLIIEHIIWVSVEAERLSLMKHIVFWFRAFSKHCI